MITSGIYVTLGKKQLDEKPYRDQIKGFLAADGENAFYWWKIHSKPKKEFTDVFIVIGGKVRWKAKFVQYEENAEPEFIDGRTMYSPLWMILIDFEPLPRPHEIRKGFQGFRYKD